MIIIGYAGIGKSSVCGKQNGIIDLESSFFHAEGDTDWEDRYASAALDLSRQGYVVFVSAHRKVALAIRRQASKTSDEDVAVIFPKNSEEMRRKWVKRLENRYFESRSNCNVPHWIVAKNYRAWIHVAESYGIETWDMRYSEVYDSFIRYVIEDEQYDLLSIVHGIQKQISEGRIKEDKQ